MIVEDKQITEELANFKIKKLNSLGWISILIIAIVPLVLVLPRFINFLSLIVISFFIAISIAPFLWRIAGKSMLKGIFIKNFKDWKENQNVGIIRKIFNTLMGVKISKDYIYYLEGSVEGTNLNSIKSLLSQRIFNVTSASLGITYTIATILRFVFGRLENPELIMGISLIIVLLSPLILFWLIPMIWGIQDANIKYQDANKDIGDLSYRISRSTLRKFIGITGITLAFGFFLDSKLLAAEANTIVQRYVMASIWVGLVIALNIGISLLCGIFYLSLYHEKIVNNFRKELIKVLEIGVTSVREISDEEKSYFK